MKITVLVDNNTITDRYFFAEPALSLFLEKENKKILFDCGYSDIFLKNALKLGLDLSNLDAIVLSHGHDDHCGALEYLKDICIKTKPQLFIAGVEFFNKRYDSEMEFGCPLSKSYVEKFFEVNISEKPVYIDENVIFLGKIPRKNDYEALEPCGMSNNLPDYIPEDSAIAIKSPQGIVIVTGCSHSGIANICEYAKEICQSDRINSIIGGLHLISADDNVLKKTCKYLKNLHLESLYACHCTGLKALCCLNDVTNLIEVGSGMTIEF